MTVDPAQSSDAAPNFEQALAELESIMHDLEEGKLGLADGLARYERGITLLKDCYKILERAEWQIELLCGQDAEGNPITEPFEAAADASLGEKSQARAKRRSASKSARTANQPAEAKRSSTAEQQSADASQYDEPGSLF